MVAAVWDDPAQVSSLDHVIDVHIMALHYHLIDENLAVFFKHFGGKGPALNLAKAVGTALTAQKAAGKVTK